MVLPRGAWPNCVLGPTGFVWTRYKSPFLYTTRLNHTEHTIPHVFTPLASITLNIHIPISLHYSHRRVESWHRFLLDWAMRSIGLFFALKKSFWILNVDGYLRSLLNVNVGNDNVIRTSGAGGGGVGGGGVGGYASVACPAPGELGTTTNSQQTNRF